MILFVDDEPRYIDPYRLELEDSGFEVTILTNIDRAVDFFTEYHAGVELVILDIMLPAGRSFRDADTKNGRRTGVFLYKQLRALAPRLPFVILTNSSDPEIEKIFVNEENCRVMHKTDYLPYELAEAVHDILSA